jgi:hypothetical protein
VACRDGFAERAFTGIRVVVGDDNLGASARNRSTVERPMPLAPPVITATLFCKRIRHPP